LTYALVVLLLITVIATYWARHLAAHRRRNIGVWAFATAMLPPLVLILWALPEKPNAKAA
jgi:membrane-associated protease RseP (regulator of RpoE activity)